MGKVYSMARYKLTQELKALEEQLEIMLEEYAKSNYNLDSYMLLVKMQRKMLDIEFELMNLPNENS